MTWPTVPCDADSCTEGYSEEYLTPCARCNGIGRIPRTAASVVNGWLDDPGADSYREINLRAYGHAPDEHGVTVSSGVVATAYFARGAVRGWAVSLSDGAFGPDTASALCLLAEKLEATPSSTPEED